MRPPGWLLGVLASSIVLFALLAQGVASQASIAELDRAIADWLRVNTTGTATAVLRTVTELGGSDVLLAVTIAAAFAFAMRRRFAHAALISASLAGAEALNLALKAAFERPRPELGDALATAAGFSFPSAHAMTAISVYGALALVVSANAKSRAVRAGLLAAATALVLAIGFSRVYLGVHYVSDVLAGYCAGLAWLALCVLIMRQLGRPSTPLLIPGST